jgi:adenylate cyclase class 2
VGYAERLSQSQEIEVKIAITSPPALRKKLRAAGFKIRRARVFEQNIALDDAAASLRGRGLLLRLRQSGKQVLCTYKGPALRGRHKRREEHEFHADNLEACLAVFAGIGYLPSFRYDKYRTEFEREGEPGHATLDETPIGVFMELEGPAAWIDETATRLGFHSNDYITASYISLYLAWCQEMEVKPGHMVFPARAT